ncbi:MAG: hypothetical protein ABIO46_08815 [Chitinophagales bacterium]
MHFKTSSKLNEIVSKNPVIETTKTLRYEGTLREFLRESEKLFRNHISTSFMWVGIHEQVGRSAVFTAGNHDGVTRCSNTQLRV